MAASSPYPLLAPRLSPSTTKISPSSSSSGSGYIYAIPALVWRPIPSRIACSLRLLDSARVPLVSLVLMESMPSSSSAATAAGSNRCCCFDAVWRACGRYGTVAGEAAGWAFCALLTCVFAVVGSLVGIFIGAFMGMSTESGMFRGAGVGAVSGAVFSIEAVESCIEIWRSSESGKYSILFVLDIISSLFSGRIVWEKVSPALQRAVQSQMSLLSTPFIDNNDLFETGSTGGMSRDLINRIPNIRFSAATSSDQETDRSCCSVCLQDFGSGQFVRVLPQCQHLFHVRCIDSWLLRHASCPLCRAGVHIDHIHM